MTFPWPSLTLLEIAVTVIGGTALLYAWYWRRRFRQRIRAEALTPKDRLELELSLDGEIARLVGGLTVILGILLTTIQILDARQVANKQIGVANQQLVTERMVKAYTLLSQDKTATRVGAVYALGSVADLDPAFRLYVYDSLLAFVREVSGGGCIPSQLGDQNMCRSKKVTEDIQAALWTLKHGNAGSVVQQI